MEAMSFEFIFILLAKFSLLVNTVNHPPSDFASLVSTKDALQLCDLKYEEKNLIKYLKEGFGDITDEAVKKAFTELASSKAAERKIAREVLIKAGARSFPYLKNGLISKDPEVRDACRKISKIISDKQEKAGANHFVKKFYALKALGELKSMKAVSILKIYKSGKDVSLANTAAQSLALCLGEKDIRPSGIQALKELSKGIPAGAGFVALLDFERASEDKGLDKIISVLAADLGKGNPLISIIKESKNDLNKILLQGLGFAANVRIDAAAFYASEEIGPKAGYLCGCIKGLYDKKRLEALLATSLEKAEHQGKTIYYDRYDFAICLIDNKTFLWSTGVGKEYQHMLPLLEAMERQESKIPTHLNMAFQKVLQGDARLAVCGRISDTTKQLVNVELGRQIARNEGREKLRPDQQLELYAMKAGLALLNSKFIYAELDAALKLNFLVESMDDNKANELKVVTEKLDKGIRDMVDFEIKKDLKRGRDDSFIVAFIKGFDLEKAFSQVSSKASKTEVSISIQQVLTIFPVAAFFM